MSAENPLQAAFNAVGTPLLVFQNNCVVFANRALLDICGDKIIGRDLNTLLKSSSLTDLNDLMSVQGKTIEIELKEAERTYWFSCTIAPLQYEGQPSLLVTAIDISSQRVANVTAEHFQKRLKALHRVGILLSDCQSVIDMCRLAVELGRTELGFDRLGVWLADTDPEHMVGTFGTGEDGVVRDERHQRIDFSPAQYPKHLSISDLHVYLREDGPIYDDRSQIVGQGWVAMARFYEGEEIIGFISADNYLLKRPVERYDMELLGLYAQLLSQLLARARALESAQNAEALFSSAFHHNPSAIVISSLETGKYVKVNDSFLQISGYTPEEVIGKSALELNIWESNAQRESVGHQLMTIGRVPLTEMRFLKKSGELVETLYEAELIDIQGKPHVLNMVQDISARKQAEQAALERERLQGALQKEQEFSTLKSGIMLRIGHEFRTPLAIIMTSTDLVERYADRITEVRRAEHFQRIRAQVNRLAGIIDNVLTAARGMHNALAFQMASFDLDALCAQKAGNFSNEKIQVEYRLGSIQQLFLGDQQLIEVLLENLLSNAVKFSSPGSVVHFEAVDSPEAVVIQVKNKGIGVPDEDLPYIFDPFYRGSNVGEIGGLGVGLAIVRDAVMQHGGEITCVNDTNGTTFTVRLPRRST